MKNTRANETKERLNETLIKIIEKVEEAGSWVKPFKASIASGAPANAQTGKYYNGVNVLNLWITAHDQGFNSNEWATFNQLKTKGYKVLKGSKSTEIFFFKPLQIKEKNDNGEEKTKTIPMIKSYRVFNLDQTDAPKKETGEEGAKVEPITHAEEFYSNLDYLEIRTGAQPSYRPDIDCITIPSINDFTGAEEYYSTLGHEYTHSTGHSSILNRPQVAKFGSEAYAYEELIAELGSVLLMAHLGLSAEPTQDNSAAYLKNWLRKLKDDPKQLWKAASAASKALNYLLQAAAIRADKRKVA